MPALKTDSRPFKLLKLRFLGDNTRENLLYSLNTRLGLETSVLFASVTEIQREVLGIFIIQVFGPEKRLQEAAAYMQSRGVKWQEVAL